MDYIERNAEIIRKRMIEQMERSLKLGTKLIETELDAGLLNLVVKPLVKAFYDYWSQHDARKGTLKQLEVTLNAGKEIVSKGASQKLFEAVENKTFTQYLQGDQTYRQCSKRHKNYGKLKDLARKTYANYLTEVVLLLQVKEDVKDYGDLCKYAFHNKEEARRILLNQLKFTENAISIVEEDPSILTIMAGKKIILKALRKGFEESKKEFLSSIENTF